MNLELLQQKLIAAARHRAPDDQVPYAFEQRVMARLKGAVPTDDWTLWGRALWRAAIPCLAVMLLSGAWTWWAAGGSPAGTDFSQEFETAVFAQSDSADYTE